MYVSKLYAGRLSVFRMRPTQRKVQSTTWNKQPSTANQTTTVFHTTGLHKAKGCSTVCRKILYITVTMLTVSVCGYICQERLRRYFSDPSEINTYYIENKTVNFPAATICSITNDVPSINPTLYRRRFGNYNATTWLYDFLNTSKYTFVDLWDVSKIDRNETVFKSWEDAEDPSAQKEHPLLEMYTVIGKCTTFFGRSNMPLYGIQTSQAVIWYGDNTELTHYMLQFHANEDADPVKYLIPSYGIAYTYELWDFLLRVTEVIYRNTRQRPCTDDVYATNKCINDCIERGIYSRLKIKCRLPYMQERDVVRPCNKAEELKDVSLATITVGRRFRKEDCNCPRKCREVSYTLDYMQQTLKPANRNVMRLWIGFADPRITIIQEEQSYNGFSLFSDLGGAIGLFLGISVLQAYESLETLYNRIIKRRR